METILNKKSGVLGITEEFVDRRDIEIAAEKGNEKAQLAIDMESYRLKKYVGSYAAALGEGGCPDLYRRRRRAGPDYP